MREIKVAFFDFFRVSNMIFDFHGVVIGVFETGRQRREEYRYLLATCFKFK